MKKSIKKENFYVVKHWMVTELGLKAHELTIFAIIYGFSQAEGNYFTGSQKYLCTWLNSTKPTINKYLKSLVKKGYLEKIDEQINGVKFCKYRALTMDEIVDFYSSKEGKQVVKNLYRGSKKSLPGVVKSLYQGSKESLPNSIEDNKEDNIENNKEGDFEKKEDYEKKENKIEAQKSTIVKMFEFAEKKGLVVSFNDEKEKSNAKKLREKIRSYIDQQKKNEGHYETKANDNEIFDTFVFILENLDDFWLSQFSWDGYVKNLQKIMNKVKFKNKSNNPDYSDLINEIAEKIKSR